MALVRALARQPKLLLLDEPLAALDKKLREDTQFELMNIQDELGTTFMVVTHDQDEAMVLANRIGVMQAGKLVQVDTPRQLYERPANRFVADFLGTISFIEADLKLQNGQLVADSSDGILSIRTDENHAAGQKVTCAIRPEKLSLARASQGDQNTLAVTVEDYAYLGVATHYRVRTEAGTRLNILQTAPPDGEAPLSWDDTGFISMRPEDIILLEA